MSQRTGIITGLKGAMIIVINADITEMISGMNANIHANIMRTDMASIITVKIIMRDMVVITIANIIVVGIITGTLVTTGMVTRIVGIDITGIIAPITVTLQTRTACGTTSHPTCHWVTHIVTRPYMDGQQTISSQNSAGQAMTREGV